MKDNQHTYEQVIEFIQQKVYLAENKSLTIQEECILKGAWDELSYEEIADSLYISSGTIRNISALLWQKLSQTFNYKITKRTFKVSMFQILDFQEISDNFTDDFIDDEADILEPKGTILLVDDKAENLQLLKQILNREGYQVKNAISGEIALIYLEKNLPDLILLDIIMPNMNGYQVCKLIKENEQTKSIPIIFLSALNETLDKVKAFKLGASDYITKPFEEVEVLTRVSHHIALKKRTLALEREIQEHQQTIEILHQSRSILASMLNSTCYGIAALQAIRSPKNGEIIDFHFLLVNSVFAKIFNLSKKQLIKTHSCAQFFEVNGLNWLDDLIKVIKTGKNYLDTFTYEGKLYKIYAIKLGDGVNVSIL